jgi:transcriptional regulator with XRE-family HTH domain
VTDVQERVQEEPCALAIRIGRNIRFIRKSKGMTLLQLGMKCGTTPQSICRLETGSMTLSVDWMEKIAEAFDVLPEDLFGSKKATTESLQMQVKCLIKQLEWHLENMADA